MTTPNEELIERLRNSRSCDELCDEAADALQSQTERIAELENDVNRLHQEAISRCCNQAELRAQLEQIAATEPVAWLIKYEYLASTENIQGSIKKLKENWFTSSLVSDDKDEEPDVLKWRNKTVEPLFTRPMPAQDVTELVEALEKLARLGNGEHYGNSDGNMIARMALNRYKGAK